MTPGRDDGAGVTQGPADHQPAQHPPHQTASPQLPVQSQKTGSDVIADAAFSGPIDEIQGAPIQDRGALPHALPPFRPPIAGALSVIFAIAAFYRTAVLLAPLALLAGIIALCRRQYNWGLIGIIAALAALATDVTFWSLIGAAWIVRWLVWS